MTRLLLCCLCAAVLATAPAVLAGDSATGEPLSDADRVEELQEEIDSLIEEVEDLQEPVAEFELFDQCMYLIGATQYGRRGGPSGYVFGAGARLRWPALALDIRGFDAPQYQFLAFPAEEPPSIECNEDSGQESIDE